MINARDIQLLAERIAQLSDNHQWISEAMKHAAGLKSRIQEQEQDPTKPPVAPPNLIDFSDLSKSKLL
ncbi:MAG TPA: hypothetical protein PK595_07300 [Bacteroidota bacterium]|nr:hypothetical protein [Bacteroidota bacterium]